MLKGNTQLHTENKSIRNPKSITEWIPKAMLSCFCFICIMTVFSQPVYAADIFSTAKSAMQKVYNDVVGIATVAAVVCSAVCLFLMYFSKTGRTVDESRTWLKRIIICWAILMLMGAVVNYMEVLIPQQNFTG